MLKSQSGKLDGILAVALGIILLIATMALFTQSNKVKYSFNVQNSMKIIKGNLYLHMDDSTGWGYTVADTNNTTLDCIRNHTDCSSMATQKNPIVTIHDVGDNLFLNNLTYPTQGVGLDGKGCTTFSTDIPNPGCPIKITITWQPSCPASPCIDPGYNVNVTFAYSIPAGYGPNVNLSQYNFILAK